MGEFTWVRPICKEPKEKKKKDISIHGENLSTLISHSKKIFTTNKILKAAIGKIFHESFIFSGWLSSSFRWKFVPCLHTFIFWGHRIIAARDRKQLQVWFIYSHIFLLYLFSFILRSLSLEGKLVFPGSLNQLHGFYLPGKDHLKFKGCDSKIWFIHWK